MSYKTNVYIDASNLFYGGKDMLGWSLDYFKLREYLISKYNANDIYYFAGIDIHDYKYDYIYNDNIEPDIIVNYLNNKLLKNYNNNKNININDKLQKSLNKAKFYSKLKDMGYNLYLKPVKSYKDVDGSIKRKANCDVDMCFHLMKDKDNIDRAIILSGDGDFLPVLKFLKSLNKIILILSKPENTAKEIKRFAGDKFMDFKYLKNILMKDKDN